MTVNLNEYEIDFILNDINDSQLENVNSFVLFLGHAHSGHSIIGSILDGHKDAAIANEVNIVKLIKEYKLNRVESLKICLFFSLKNKNTKSWNNTEYKYNITNSHQGLSTHPEVIGDKKAGGTTRIIMNNQWVLEYLNDIFGKELKLIYVARSPFDIISAYSYYWKEELNVSHIDRYFENLNAVKQITQSYKVINICQNSFVRYPCKEIQRLFKHLSIKNSEKVIKPLVKIVRNDIKSRYHVIGWNKAILNYYFSKLES